MASVRTSGAAIGDRVRRRLPAALVLGAGVLALAGCAEADRPQSTMDPKGENAQKIQNLQWPVFLIAGVVGVIVVRHASSWPSSASGSGRATWRRRSRRTASRRSRSV